MICVEDANYTSLGRSDHDGRRFGSYGHYAVLNFSQGKKIPVGGGAVVTNIDAGDEGAALAGRAASTVAGRRPLGARGGFVVARGGWARVWRGKDSFRCANTPHRRVEPCHAISLCVLSRIAERSGWAD